MMFTFSAVMSVVEKVLLFIGIILGSLILLVILLAFLLNRFTTEGKSRSDEEFVEYIKKNEDNFAYLNSELSVYSNHGLQKIDGYHTIPEYYDVKGLEYSKVKEIRKALKAADIVGGAYLYVDGRIRYVTYSYGLSISGGSQSIYYSQNPSSEWLLCKDVPEVELSKGYQSRYVKDCIREEEISEYREIYENWYIKD